MEYSSFGAEMTLLDRLKFAIGSTAIYIGIYMGIGNQVDTQRRFWEVDNGDIPVRTVLLPPGL